MHLLSTSSTSLDDIVEPVDLGQPPGDICILSFADSDLAGLAAAWAIERGMRCRAPHSALAYNQSRVGPRNMRSISPHRSFRGISIQVTMGYGRNEAAPWGSRRAIWLRTGAPAQWMEEW
jgi:hypothetical protein